MPGAASSSRAISSTLIGCDDKPQRHLWALEDYTEQEAHGRYGPIDGCRTDSTLMLIDLKPPEIFDRGRIGRLAQKGGKAPNMPDVVLLRVLPKNCSYPKLVALLRPWLINAMAQASWLIY